MELEALTWRLNGGGGTTSFIANGMSSVREFLNTTFLRLYLMQTSRKQISMFTEEEFQSCQAASLVNPTQVLESDSEKRMNATCGPKCLEQFEKFSHVGSWAKTFSALLIGMEGWYSKRCRLTWKLKGTKSNRLYFQLVQSTLPTEEIESGLLLGTPRAQERSRSERFRKGRTPTPSEYAEQFKGLLLTPTSVMTDEPPEKMRERAERNGYKNGTQYGSLLSQVKYGEMLPTPTTGADQKTQYQQGGRSLMNYMDFQRNAPDSDGSRSGQDYGQGKSELGDKGDTLPNWDNFPTEPPICGGDDGLSDRLDNITFPKWRNESIKAYGNAIVPQVAHQIFKAIEAYEESLLHRPQG